MALKRRRDERRRFGVRLKAVLQESESLFLTLQSVK
jgi:hypothetical protein